jgi:hypothetical protein
MANKVFINQKGITTKIHLAACSAKSALAFILTGGNVHYAPAGRDLLDGICSEDNYFCTMDRAYEGDVTRAKAVESGLISSPVSI